MVFFLRLLLGWIRHSVVVRCLIDVLLFFSSERGQVDYHIPGCRIEVQYLAVLASLSTGSYS
jgi:hypothetical protein